MTTYRCLSKNTVTENNYTLVPLREGDIYLIKDWRNAQMDILRQSAVLTDDDQKNYFYQHVCPDFDREQPAQLLFSYLHGQECVGYGGLTNIDWSSLRAEISFLLNPVYTENQRDYQEKFALFLTLIKKIAFEHLPFHRLFTETYDCRPVHIQALENNGFVSEGRMKDHVMIREEFVDALIHGCVKGAAGV